MALKRIFLGWDRPLLQVVVDYLQQRYRRDLHWDLSQLILVVPGGRVGRRLLEAMAVRAADQGWLLDPPEFTTPGRFPEYLYHPRRPFASSLIQTLAWSQALRQVPAAQLQALTAQLPKDEDTGAWLQLGGMLRDLHRELASDHLKFADVAHVTASPQLPAAAAGLSPDVSRETRRWESLATIQTRYLALLDDLGLWDRQTARQVAIEQQECRSERDVLLVGLVDLNTTLRQMVDEIAQRVTVLVLADPAEASHFDPHGCVLADDWHFQQIQMEREQIRVVDGPEDQAAAVVHFLADLDGHYRADQITIGVPDEKLVPRLLRQLRAVGVRGRYGPGRPIRETPVTYVLTAIAGWWQARTYESLASLVRHPDVQLMLGRLLPSDWLTQLDNYHSRHLPDRVGGWWPDRDTATVARLVYEQLQHWLSPLAGSPPAADQAAEDGAAEDGAAEDGAAGARASRREAVRRDASLPGETARVQPLADWALPIERVLEGVHRGREWVRDDPVDETIIQSLRRLAEILEGWREIPASLAPRVTAGEALRWLVEDLGDARLAEPADADAVELLGWLELPWDDAPVLAVTAMNEGVVPQAHNADMFLPNQLRHRLGLEDNQRRLARDAYALRLLLASRRQLRLIAGRRGTAGDPLLPSRLLFAADANEVAQRVLHFYGDPQADGAGAAGGKAVALFEGRRQTPFVPPAVLEQPQLSPRMRVTDFGMYLDCPYRYYLRRVIGLQSVEDGQTELSGAGFGSLLHDVLERFGKSPARDSSDPDEIRGVLQDALAKIVYRTHGKDPLPTVRIQVEQMRLRLDAFALAQARRTAAGWRILCAEPDSPEVDFLVDDRPIRLTGRIDRIDRHVDTGHLAVWDYKSSDAGRTPQETHRAGDAWCDLQLPLYRHLIGPILQQVAPAATGDAPPSGPRDDGPRDAGPRDDVVLGYVLLPKDIRNVEFCPAEWSPTELGAADKVACQVVRDIREGKFTPSTRRRAYADELDGICLEGVLQ